MDTSSIRVLVVDDYEPWRRFFLTTLQKRPELLVIAEAADGLEGVQQAQQLQPDLIMLDVGLPTLNGIEAARRIRAVSPASKILFVSENRSVDVVEKALSAGAGGYLVKSDAGSQLSPAIEAVLQGARFVSANVAGNDLLEPPVDASDSLRRSEVVNPFRIQKKVCHEVEFYSDDTEFVDGFARFIEAALKKGNPVIVIATDSHEASIYRRLTADGFNMPAEIEQGNYISFEVTNTLSSFMVNHSPDPVLLMSVAGNLMQAAKQAKGESSRVAACGEGVHILLAAGNVEATIALERLWNEVAELYDVDILCGYFRSDFATNEDIATLERVCAEHSAAHGQELCLG